MYYYWPAGYQYQQRQPEPPCSCQEGHQQQAYPQQAYPQQQVYYRDPHHQQQVEPKTFSDAARFLEMTLQAIYNERKAQLFYTAMLQMATTPFQKRNIRHALEDEMKHEKMLTQMYELLIGQKLPDVPFPQPEPVSDMVTALATALEDELEAAEHYRDMYKMTMSHWVRDILFELQTDEMEHATRFAFLRAEL